MIQQWFCTTLCTYGLYLCLGEQRVIGDHFFGSVVQSCKLNGRHVAARYDGQVKLFLVDSFFVSGIVLFVKW